MMKQGITELLAFLAKGSLLCFNPRLNVFQCKNMLFTRAEIDGLITDGYIDSLLSITDKGKEEVLGPMTQAGLYQVTLPYAVFGIVMQNNQVVDAAPIGKWMMGKLKPYVERWVSKKGGSIVFVSPTGAVTQVVKDIVMASDSILRVHRGERDVQD